MAAKKTGKSAYQRFVHDYSKAHPGLKGGELISSAAAAWRAQGGGGSGGRSGGGGVRTDGEGQITTGSRTVINATLQARPDWHWDREQLGALWTGAVDQAREDANCGPNVEEYFPPLDETGNIDREWTRLQGQRAIGEQMFAAEPMAAALIHLEVSEQEWVAIYRNAMAQAGQCAPGFSPQAPSRGGWTSPLAAPSSVTSPFGADRGGRRHTGVDLRAAQGSEITAPVDMLVQRIYYDDEGGTTLRAVAKRPDGSFPMDAAGKDDTGYRLYFSHLQATEVAEGAVVQEGQVFAFSGGTPGAPGSGTSTSGPHLHFALEWLQDNTIIDDRVFIDPLTMISTAVIQAGSRSGATGPDPQSIDGVSRAVLVPRRVAPAGQLPPPQAQQPTNALLQAAGMQQQTQPAAVTIVNSGVVGIGQTTAAQPSLNLGAPGGPFSVNPLLDAARIPIIRALPQEAPQLYPGGTGQGGELADLFAPEVVGNIVPLSRNPFDASGFWGGVVPKVSADVLQGLGELTGTAFRFAASPQGVNLVRVGTQAALGAGQAALAVAAAVAPLAGPLVSAVPYVGPVLGAVFSALPAVATLVNPLLSAASAALNFAPPGFPGQPR